KEQQRIEEEKRALAKAEQEKREREQKKRDDEKRQREIREALIREQREKEQVALAQIDERQRLAQQETANRRALQTYTARIRNKIRGNITAPPDIPGNPEAVVEVLQLPTGEVIDVKLQKSSGFPPWDEAVQRAILKSSPLPRPDQPQLFDRHL